VRTSCIAGAVEWIGRRVTFSPPSDVPPPDDQPCDLVLALLRQRCLNGARRGRSLVGQFTRGCCVRSLSRRHANRLLQVGPDGGRQRQRHGRRHRGRGFTKRSGSPGHVGGVPVAAWFSGHDRSRWCVSGASRPAVPVHRACGHHRCGADAGCRQRARPAAVSEKLLPLQIVPRRKNSQRGSATVPGPSWR
jgi:hypothetical protein